MKRLLVIGLFICIFLFGFILIRKNFDQIIQRGQPIIQRNEPDWANFVVLNGITYDEIQQHVGRKITSEDIGKEYGAVKHRLRDDVYDPFKYKIKDGDSPYLEVGTKIFEVKGYKPQYRLATYFNGELCLFTAVDNPNAKIGNDILDIKDKVTYIGINDAWDGKTELANIKNKEKVKRLTDIVLNAKIDKTPRDLNGEHYFICFYLEDGTAHTPSYYIDEGYLSPGIIVPEEFGTEIKKALEDRNVVDKLNGINTLDIINDLVSEFVKSKGCTIQMNSVGGTWIRLPKDFNEIVDGFELGKFLKQRNKKSMEYGFDFSRYMGKEVYYRICRLEKNGKVDEDLIVLLSDKKIVGAWTFDSRYDSENNDHNIMITNVEIIER